MKLRLPHCFALPMATVAVLSAASVATAEDANWRGGPSALTVHVLFVGDSFTHGRYDPVRQFAGGYDTGPGAVTAPHVHDLLCPSAVVCSAAETVAPTDPDHFSYPSGDDTLAAKLAYLTANPATQYAETGPFGGVPGILLRLSQEAHVRLDVSILAVSASTLGGKNLGGNKANAALIENAYWDHVVLQDQSSQPLPAQIIVDGRTVATKGDPAAFASGVAELVSGIDAADQRAGRAPIPVTLFQTPPMASYGFVSSDTSKLLYGTSYGSPIDAPYVGAADPMAQMEDDIRASYRAVAASWNALNPSASHIDISAVGEAWIAAMQLGVAQRNPFLPAEPRREVDLWDSDVLDACCTVPIGYHPSSAGAYLDALVLFATLTGRDPLSFGAFDPIARTLGIPAATASGLQASAAKVFHASSKK